MKKLICLLLVFFLCACNGKGDREDYTIVKINDLELSVGYDDASTIGIYFMFDKKDTLIEKETFETDLYYVGKYFGKATFYNPTKKEIPFDEAILTNLKIYIEDVGDDIAINGVKPVSSVEENCQNNNGEYVYNYAPACVIETNKNVVRLYGDILEINQDTLNHFEILTK